MKAERLHQQVLAIIRVLSLFFLTLCSPIPCLAQQNETPDSSVVILSTEVVPNLTEDRAGPWEHFSPGTGRINSSPIDWHWKLRFSVNGEVRVTGITILHTQSNFPVEAWSTTSNKVHDPYNGDKLTYPIVVIEDQIQINHKYDDEIGQYRGGIHELDLFAQRENPIFNGGKIILYLSNRSFVEGKIAAAP